MARVCMVALTDYFSDNRVRREAEALAARGDMIHVVCPPVGSADERELAGGVVFHPARTLRYSGKNPLLYALQYLGFFFAASIVLLRQHRKYRYDIVHAHTMPDFLVFTAAVPKLLGARVILDVHDLTPELYASKFGVSDSHWLIRLLRWLERRSVSFADAAIAVHKPHLDALVAHGNREDSFTVVMNVPDPNVIVPPAGHSCAHQSTFSLIYHGTVSERHGLEIAARAVALARQESVDVNLHVIGKGDGLTALEELARELSLGEHVVVTRHLYPIEELIPMISASSAGIVPIVDDSFTRYMLPVKLLEYVALGVPVICARTSTIRAYFDEGMLCYFTPGDVQDLAAKIVLLARNPDIAAGYARSADAFTSRFGWEKQRSHYYELIDSLTPQTTKDEGRTP